MQGPYRLPKLKAASMTLVYGSFEIKPYSKRSNYYLLQSVTFCRWDFVTKYAMIKIKITPKIVQAKSCFRLKF